MKSALVAKYSQNPALLALLQSTGEKRLVEVSPGDSYWGTGRTGKGKNRMGALLGEVRRELKDVRVDEQVLAAQPGVVVVQNTEDVDEEAEVEAEAEDAAADADAGGLTEGARQFVAEATGGIVRLEPEPAAGGGGGGAAPNWQKGGSGGGIYMFINPQVGGAMEAKARQARHPGRKRNLRWDGMPVSDQSGGAPENMTIDTGAPTLISVEKLE